MYSPVRPQYESLCSASSITPCKMKCPCSPKNSTPISTSLRSFSESNIHDMSLDQSDEKGMCLMPFPRESYLRQHLVTPKPPARAISTKSKFCGRVLTSSENIRLLEEKEQRKKVLLKEKEERQRLRLEKKQQKERAKTATKPSMAFNIILSSMHSLICIYYRYRKENHWSHITSSAKRPTHTQER